MGGFVNHDFKALLQDRWDWQKLAKLLLVDDKETLKE